MDPSQLWQYLEALQPVSRGAEIAEWGMLVLSNGLLRGSQKIRCKLPGVFARQGGAAAARSSEGTFYGKHVQDCVFVIDPDTSEADSALFDYANPQHRGTVVYGRVYSIFEFRVRYFTRRKRSHKGAAKATFSEQFQDEICILLKQFERVAGTYTQPGIQPELPRSLSSRGRGGGARATGNLGARALDKAGCIKLKEKKRSASTWSVVPVSYILGSAALAPVTLQKSSPSGWTRTTDNQERLWWTLPWTERWGKDRTYRIFAEHGGKSNNDNDSDVSDPESNNDSDDSDPPPAPASASNGSG